jgi:hypothetical protein
MRLYNVVLSVEVVVLAENEDAASELAVESFDEIDPDSFDSKARPMDSLPDGWDDKSIPLGDEDPEDPDRTVEEWAKLGAAPRYVESKKKKP